MRPRFQLVVTFDTLAHATTVRANLVTQLAGRNIFDTLQFVARINIDGVPEVQADWRFNGAADRNSVRDYIQDQVQNHPQVKNWVESARLSWHDCSHDDPTVLNCKTTAYAEFTR